MDKTCLLEFLSEDNLNLHLFYYKRLREKYSIFEKSYESLRGASSRDVMRSRLPAKEREQMLRLYFDCEAHGCYFSSFSRLKHRCERVREQFGSEDRLLYHIFERAREQSGGFIHLLCDCGRVKITGSEEKGTKLSSPILSLDLAEHAYFLDYGFEYEKYLRAAISRLDLEKLDKALTLS